MTRTILILTSVFTALKAELEEQIKDEARLNEIISANLSKIKTNE